jgi:hypothetical protein
MVVLKEGTILALSALLTTTMTMMKTVIDALVKAGLRGKTKAICVAHRTAARVVCSPWRCCNQSRFLRKVILRHGQIRFLAIDRKITQGTRGEAGRRWCERIWTVLATVLPRTRSEDATFRELVAKGQISWRPLWEKTDDEGAVIDRFFISDQPAATAEGYRLVWYHSLRKAELDAVARSGRIERALKQMAALREKLRSPRTRYRQEAKVAEAGAEVLQAFLPARLVQQAPGFSVTTEHQPQFLVLDDNSVRRLCDRPGRSRDTAQRYGED